MVFGLGPQILEDTLLPVSLHMIPILNHTMANRIMYSVCLGISHSLIADMKVEILDPSFGREIGPAR